MLFSYHQPFKKNLVLNVRMVVSCCFSFKKMALVIQFPLIPLFSKKSHVAPLLQVCKSIAKVLLVNRYFLANDDRLKFLFHTPSGLVNEVVLDMI
jgi:hypothetical protein